MKRLVLPAVTTLVLACAMAFLAMTPPVRVCEAPQVALPTLAGFEMEEIEVSEAERTVLPGDTRIEKRLYRAPDGYSHQVSLVVGGTSKSSIHRPELCLPAQGLLMKNPHTVTAGGLDWRFIRLDGGTRQASLGFAYTFFNQAGYHTSSHTLRILRDVWDRSILNRIDRWVMLTVVSSCCDEAALTAFLATLKEGLK